MGERVIRKSARLIVISERDDIFLLRSEDQVPVDPANPHILTYWVTPGGGVEPGETWEEAALRELWEETGIEGVDLGPWVWSREKDCVLFERAVRGIERYYLVRAGGMEIHGRNRLPHEVESYRRERWWSVPELRGSSEIFFPEGLADLLEPLLAGDIPPEPLKLDV